MSKNNLTFWILITIFCTITSCHNDNEMKQEVRIIFLHHSTGKIIWDGGDRGTSLSKQIGKVNSKFSRLFMKPAFVPEFFKDYNHAHQTNYRISEKIFPKLNPYGWNNYPYDYYNIWVKNAGDRHYQDEPTLELLTNKYDIIMFKHCFPISRIQGNTGLADINSDEKRLENYILQYNALKQKLSEFPKTKFIIWTPAVCNKYQITEKQALATREFHDWLVNEWDEQGDNIFLWDFYNYETEGGLYLSDKYMTSKNDSHPNNELAKEVAPELCKFIIKVIGTD